MFQFPLDNPAPDFESFEEVLRGRKEPQRVHLAELFVDWEVIKFVVEEIIGKRWNSLDENETVCLKRYIDFFYYLGYDYVPMGTLGGFKPAGLCDLSEADDTAILSRGKRSWANTGRGLIRSWQDFEKFPWEEIDINLSRHRFIDENIPEGMKMVVFNTFFDHILARLLGYEGFFYLIYDEPELVKAVFDKWGEKVYEFYKNIVTLENLGAIFHADDLGFKTSAMLSPDTLRELVFPWFKKYASLAHENGKMYWYHCCGYKDEIMEDLIKDVKIDALHSFEDTCCPVTEYKKKYGDKIAILGGIDIDKLCRSNEKDLRKYVKDTLNKCMKGGRYALGSGNSVTNYIPVKNYLIMLDEGLKWHH